MTLIRRMLPLVAVGLVAAACSSSAAVVGSIDASTARNLIAEPGTILLDIRTPEEFDEVRIDGSINIDFYAADFADRIAALDRDARYVVYCRSASRSAVAIDLFVDLGFTDVHEIEGGILAWLAAGLPAVGG